MLVAEWNDVSRYATSGSQVSDDVVIPLIVVHKLTMSSIILSGRFLIIA